MRPHSTIAASSSLARRLLPMKLSSTTKTASRQPACCKLVQLGEHLLDRLGARLAAGRSR